MRFYPVDGWVAFAPMPSEDELEELAGRFQAVVAAVEGWELEYSPRLARELLPGGWLPAPIRDYGTPGLRLLAEVLRWVEERVEAGYRVLIHCRGGRGRSATLAAAWLVYRHSTPPEEAVAAVRGLRSGAVETGGQVGSLRSLWMSLQATGWRLQQPPPDVEWRTRLGLLVASLVELLGSPGEALRLAANPLDAVRGLDEGDARGVADLEAAEDGDERPIVLAALEEGERYAAEAWLHRELPRLLERLLGYRPRVEAGYW